MKKTFLLTILFATFAAGHSAWADQNQGKQQQQNQQRQQSQQNPEIGDTDHLLGDAALVAKNTGDPNTSLLTSQYANNLPIMNHEKGLQGCYIACYSHAPGVYSVEEFGVHGLIRVDGKYPVTAFSNETDNRICHPDNQNSALISEETSLQSLCHSHFESCQNGCWPGGDTGGFFLRMGPATL